MFLAMHVADFPVVAALRSHPDAGARPCGILDTTAAGTGEKLPLLAVNPIARGAGILAGGSLNRALVRCPDFQVLERDPAAEAQLLTELVRLAETLTPDLEITSADSVILDLSLRRQPSTEISGGWPWPDGELAWALAATPDLAILAARQESTRGREVAPADLAALPLAALRGLAGSAAAFRTLEWWGLRTLGDFMKLPRQSLIERLGADAGRWQDILAGRHHRPLRLHRVAESLLQRHEFEDPVSSVEPLLFALRHLIHSLAARLAPRHLAVSSLELRLELDDGNTLSRSLRLPEPRSSEAGILPPLQALVESLRLESAVAALSLDAATTFGTSAQREWLGRQLPQPERWAETLAKLEAMLGPGRVGIPLPAHSHRPDAFELLPAISAPPPSSGFQPETNIPLRRYRPSRIVAVAHESRHGRPFPLALLGGPHPGRIIGWRGPFPLSGSWWDPAAAWQHLEWDIRLESHHILRLAHTPPDAWRLEGIYP